MFRRLIILLLIVGCEEPVAPEDACGVAGGDGANCISDIDENYYKTIQIGNQLWMAENLKVTHYNNGDEITHIINNEDWGSFVEGQYGIYDNNPTNADIYGNLYNGAVVNDDRGVCPEGFHVPSDEEFMELEMFLGMSEEEAYSEQWRGTDEGSKLAGHSDLWNDGLSYGSLVNNSEFGTSGFNGLPAGCRISSNGSFYGLGLCTYFSSSSESNDNRIWSRDVCWSNSNVKRYDYGKQGGLSIRCLKD